MKKSVAFLLGLMLVVGKIAHAQNQCTFCEELKNNVVRITTTMSDGSDENGFGTVVSEVSNKLYIVTAKHVVYRLDNKGLISDEAKPTDIKVKFFKDQGKSYTASALKLKANNVDVTLLEVAKPQNFKWTKNFYSKSVENNPKVWFIGRGQEWYVPTGTLTGSINKIVSNGDIILDITSILPGTSGAPLVSSDGIVGLIYEDSPTGSRAYAIEKVMKLVRDWNYQWQMNLNTNVSQPDISESEDNAWLEIVKEKKEKNKVEKLADYVAKNQGSHVNDAKVQLEGLLFADLKKPRYQEMYLKYFPNSPRINDVENIVWKESSNYVEDLRYESYISLFPNGKYYDRAVAERKKLDENLGSKEEDALFADVKSDRPFALEKYLEKYPKGKYLDDIDDVTWANALTEESQPAFKEQGFEEYLKYFPKGKHAAEATQKVKKYKR